ncbi:unnamed protein product [Dibothriocephalus latus]|uniref:BTB domain-containing protein n=1 Tax=Dibothriocephalus latus TaxID=60516 RepID=A0A3P7L3T0_DIBLA|nr:unnamed protein product [Dibothriocephalus latus]
MESAVTEKANYVDVATLRARIDFLTSEFSSLATKYANVRNELDRLSCQSSDSASNFSKNLLHFVASLFDNQQYSDVEFKTKTNPIKAHRFILKARGAQWSETADSKFIDISHVPEDVARTFVKWLYTGDCERATEASDDFLLQIETLIIPRICKENFVKVFGSAYENNAKNLTDRCLAFAKDIYVNLAVTEINILSRLLVLQTWPHCPQLVSFLSFASTHHPSTRLPASIE